MENTVTWDTIFNRYKSLGIDPSDAAYRADQWEKRQHQDRWANCPSTHCERWHECRSPYDCSARVSRGGGGEKMNQRKDDYMRGYGDGFKDGLAEAKRSDRRRPEPNQPDMTHEADIRVISDVQT
jgi:hypothetical protein